MDEAEGTALEDYLRDQASTLVSSQLTEVELVRAVSRADPDLVTLATRLLKSVVLLPISGSVREVAGRMTPKTLRSLDAIHLATALEIRADLSGMLTYDNRMMAAAAENGLPLVTVG